MKLAAFLGLFAVLFPAIAFYCFKHRTISSRFGAFYILVIAVACEALLVSAFAVEAARRIGHSVTGDFSGTGDLVDQAGPDPSGAALVGIQPPLFPKHSEWSELAWRSWQNRLRDYLIDNVYELNFRPAEELTLRATVKREITETKLVRREYAIPAADGDTIPAVVLVPKDSTLPLPGILFIHGHVADGDSGLAQMVLPVDSYHRSAARELALAGFATVAIELRGFGMRGPPEFPDHHVVAYNATLTGGFYKKLLFSDIKRTIDFFGALGEIDPQRLGVTGVSLGAELAVEYAALDERIKAISFHAHGGRTGPHPGMKRPRSKQPHHCHLVPGFNRIMRQEDPFLLLAPRPTQGVRGGDELFAESAFEPTLQRLWSLLGHAEALELEVVPGAVKNGGHTYYVDQSVRFFKEHL